MKHIHHKKTYTRTGLFVRPTFNKVLRAPSDEMYRQIIKEMQDLQLLQTPFMTEFSHHESVEKYGDWSDISLQAESELLESDLLQCEADRWVKYLRVIDGNIDLVTYATEHDMRDFVGAVFNTDPNVYGDGERMTAAEFSLDVYNSTPKKLQFKSLMGNSRVIGQELAIQSLDKLFRYKLNGIGIQPSKPIASLLLTGPTGVGKTETAALIAEIIYGDANAVVRFNCNECQSEGGQWRCFGAPTGYLGSNKEGVIAVGHQRHEGRCVILFDEIEKGSREILDAVLGGLDDGYFTTNASGIKLDLSECVIIFTSNALANSDLLDANESDLRAQLAAYTVQTAHGTSLSPFRPEFIGRIDAVLAYKAISAQDMQKIIQNWYSKISEQICKDKYFSFAGLSDQIAHKLAELSLDKPGGVRGALRWIEQEMFGLCDFEAMNKNRGIWRWHDADNGTLKLQRIP